MIIRSANGGDVPLICVLLAHPAMRGAVLPRSETSIADSLDDWIVGLDEQHELVGCVALQAHRSDLAEIRSLAVSPLARGKGFASALLRSAVAQGCNEASFRSLPRRERWRSSSELGFSTWTRMPSTGRCAAECCALATTVCVSMRCRYRSMLLPYRWDLWQPSRRCSLPSWHRWGGRRLLLSASMSRFRATPTGSLRQASTFTATGRNASRTRPLRHEAIPTLSIRTLHERRTISS